MKVGVRWEDAVIGGCDGESRPGVLLNFHEVFELSILDD